MARFRETLWFKKGSQDAAAAQTARAKRGTLDPVGVDQLPVEDRYQDDGSLTAVDTAQWSVKTGTTQPIARMRDVAPVDDKVQMATVMSEMKRGRAPIFAVLGASAVAITVIVAMFFA
jgi:hypothetical protein